MPVDSSADIILQAFNWEVCEYGSGWFKALAAKAAHLHASGFAAVWLPPASVSVSKEVTLCSVVRMQAWAMPSFVKLRCQPSACAAC